MYKGHLDLTSLGLGPKMNFYSENFLLLRDNLIIHLQFTQRHWPHGLKFPLNKLKICSHRRQIESGHCIIVFHERIGYVSYALCKSWSMGKNFIFKCPMYYEICGRYHFLFRDTGESLSSFCCFDESCLDIFMHEVVTQRRKTLQETLKPFPMGLIISSFQRLEVLSTVWVPWSWAQCVPSDRDYVQPHVQGTDNPSIRGHGEMPILEVGLLECPIQTPKLILLDSFHPL